MRRDLQGLPITKGELRRLSGVSVDDIIKPYDLVDGEKKAKFISKQTTVISGLGAIFFVAFLTLGDVTIWEMRGTTVDMMLVNTAPGLLFGGVGVVSAFAALLTRFFWLQKNAAQAPSLLGLLNDVDKYNELIEAIDLNDKLEAAGNPEVRLANREEIIDTLRRTRHDLIRALRTDRLLRENRKFIDRNPELFASNLDALSALKINDKATERGRRLNEALQIALNAKGEMRRLHKRKHY